jgi:hypothetical protein
MPTSLQAPVLFRIADVRRMNIVADISQADIPAFRPGTDVTIRFESIADAYHGTVSQVRLQPISAQAASAAISSQPRTAPSPDSPTSTGITTTAPPTNGPTTTSSAPTSGVPGNQGGAAPAAPTPTGQSAASATPLPSGSSSTPSSTAGASVSSAATPLGAGSGIPATSSGVVAYQAIIEVDNPVESLAPGRTVVVTLSSLQREHVVRLPNNALTFRPRIELLSRGSPEAAPRGRHHLVETGRA